MTHPPTDRQPHQGSKAASRTRLSPCPSVCVLSVCVSDCRRTPADGPPVLGDAARVPLAHADLQEALAAGRVHASAPAAHVLGVEQDAARVVGAGAHLHEHALLLAPPTHTPHRPTRGHHPPHPLLAPSRPASPCSGRAHRRVSYTSQPVRPRLPPCPPLLTSGGSACPWWLYPQHRAGPPISRPGRYSRAHT